MTVNLRQLIAEASLDRSISETMGYEMCQIMDGWHWRGDDERCERSQFLMCTRKPVRVLEPSRSAEDRETVIFWLTQKGLDVEATYSPGRYSIVVRDDSIVVGTDSEPDVGYAFCKAVRMAQSYLAIKGR